VVKIKKFFHIVARPHTEFLSKMHPKYCQSTNEPVFFIMSVAFEMAFVILNFFYNLVCASKAHQICVIALIMNAIHIFESAL